jgi:pimeloyl-ACP methyl ester carboxylesterase
MMTSAQELAEVETPVNAAEQDLPPALARVHPAWRDFEPEWRTQPCPFAPRTDFDKNKIECGYVLVPENRREPDSRLIKLSAARLVADVDDPPAGTTMFLSGGPGTPLLRSVPARAASSAAFRKMRRASSHWIYLDQRGIGFSEPRFCRGIHPDLSHPEPGSEAWLERRFSERERCLREAAATGVDPGAYTTWDVAMDVRDLRRALGLERWNVYGISYGTEIAQMLLQIDAPAVRAAALESVVAPPPWDGEIVVKSLRSALDGVNEACREHGDCAARFGDLDALAQRAVAAYAEPLKLVDIDPDASETGEMWLNDWVMASAVFRILYDQALYPGFPAWLEAVARRDPELMQFYAPAFAQPAELDRGHGLFVVANCAGKPRIREAQVEAALAAEPFWGRYHDDLGWTGWCDRLGFDGPDPLARAPEFDGPALVIMGRIDPITPPSSGRAILPALGNVTYVEVPYAGHLPTRMDCPAAILSAFLERPGEAPDAGCIEDMPPPAFVTDYKPTRGPARLAEALTEGRYEAAWGALPALVLAIAFLAFPVAAAGRRIDGRGVRAPRPRVLAWVAALFGLAGVALIVGAFQQTLAISESLIALGLIGPTGWATAALVLALLAAAASLWSLRGGERSLGTTVGVGLTALSVVLVFAFTVHRELVF